MVLEASRPSLWGCAGHSKIAGNLRSGVQASDQTDSASNLTVGEGSATKVRAGFSAFADRACEAFAFNLVLHLRESDHDRVQYRIHG